MSHLRDVVAALVDGELSDSERDRALVHLAGCATCRAEVAAHRAIKERLRAAAAPAPSGGFMAELLRMAEPGEPLPPTKRADETTRPPTVPVGRRPGDRGATRPAGVRNTGRRRVRTALTGGTVVLATTLITAFAVGGDQPGPTDAVTPDLESYVVEHARTSRVVPFAEVPTEVVGVSVQGDR